ncbi:DUF2809 domain-containing protein [Paenibacillus sp. 2TAB19]|uniref:ribosomal maturation YjgA family protein n=1 Tax=Paenibacillus sp. 2TAB19 TaxID=3233003 RepID=UPI003F9E943B
MKARLYYGAAILFLIAAGLGVRRYSAAFPPFVSDHFGDGLWACMIYCGVRCLWVNKMVGWAVVISTAICFGIEFSQLYQANWINEIRDTTLGALVLGHGFLFVDLVRYSIGIMLAVIVDGIMKRLSPRT